MCPERLLAARELDSLIVNGTKINLKRGSRRTLRVQWSVPLRRARPRAWRTEGHSLDYSSQWYTRIRYRSRVRVGRKVEHRAQVGAQVLLVRRGRATRRRRRRRHRRRRPALCAPPLAQGDHDLAVRVGRPGLLRGRVRLGLGSA